MGFKIQQVVVFFEKVANFGINFVVGFLIDFSFGEPVRPMRLKLVSQLSSEDGVREINQFRESVLVLKLAAMKVSIEIGLSVSS